MPLPGLVYIVGDCARCASLPLLPRVALACGSSAEVGRSATRWSFDSSSRSSDCPLPAGCSALGRGTSGAEVGRSATRSPWRSSTSLATTASKSCVLGTTKNHARTLPDTTRSAGREDGLTRAVSCSPRHAPARHLRAVGEKFLKFAGVLQGRPPKTPRGSCKTVLQTN
jgi:hypothetical protein